jgi:hypothetical protein
MVQLAYPTHTQLQTPPTGQSIREVARTQRVAMEPQLPPELTRRAAGGANLVPQANLLCSPVVKDTIRGKTPGGHSCAFQSFWR